MKYSLTMRILHWLMAIMILGLIAVGWYMQGIPDEDPNKYNLYPWHKSFGVTLLVLVIIRFFVRLFSDVPAPPKALAGWEKTLSKITHVVLYLLMLLVPLSGLMMSDYAGFGVAWFGIELPEFLADNEQRAVTLHSIHSIIPYVLLGLVILHLAGAIKHRFFDKNSETDVLKRML
ncbi:MAG: cytochrome b [Kangiellaceae bacterium]|nr:cytochrome b [Kangiellaceae bacterium]